MSASAYGKVVYGYRLDHQLLRVSDGIGQVCQSNPSHEIMKGGVFCPQCGSSIVTRDQMVPSPVVVKYALQHRLTLDEALKTLDNYQHQLRQWHSNEKGWVFGVPVVSGGTNSCSGFEALTHPSRIEELEKAVRLFDDLGLDLTEAKYYLVVKLA